FLGGSLPALLDGLKVTLELALVSNLIGLVAGFGLSLMTLSRWFFIRWPAQLFVEFFRCTPALLQIVWFFYCLPMLFGLFIEPIVMGFLVLGLN
ncbi:UNVERIFIED_CONTAM: ABC transporter permease subunit, partial [Pseudomonas aeruginosa]